MRSLEATLTTLLEKVAPGELKVAVPRFAVLQDLDRCEVSFRTRGYDEVFCGKSIREAAEMALESLEDPPAGDVDPIVPSWYRLSRMQRQFVEQTLKGLLADHMARAASLNIARSPQAHAEYAMADAFQAALVALEFDDVDEHLAPLPVEPLQARVEAEKKETDWVDSTGDLRKKKGEALSSAVAALKKKNRGQARRS